jgi:hypothetical protein
MRHHEASALPAAPLRDIEDGRRLLSQYSIRYSSLKELRSPQVVQVQDTDDDLFRIGYDKTRDFQLFHF